MPANNFTLVWRKSNGAFPGARDLIDGFA